MGNSSFETRNRRRELGQPNQARRNIINTSTAHEKHRTLVQSQHEAALEVLRGVTLEAEEAADDNDADNDDGEFSRGRKKHDAFHQFQSMPIGKLCPLRSTSPS